MIMATMALSSGAMGSCDPVSLAEQHLGNGGVMPSFIYFLFGFASFHLSHIETEQNFKNTPMFHYQNACSTSERDKQNFVCGLP